MSEVNFAYPMGGRQFTNDEKQFLHELAYGSQMICEIGSWVGDSTEALGNCARKTNGKVYCVDWFKGNPGTDLIGRAKQNDIYSIFRNNMKSLGLEDVVCVLHMKSTAAAHIVKDESFDFIFLDADHTYEPVKQDLEFWWGKLQKGGIFAGHDYDDPEYDEEHIHKDYVQNKHHGLIKAVNEKFDKVNKGAGTLWWVQK